MCSIDGCNLENFEDKDKCILHCEKDNWYFTDKDGNKNWDKSKKKINHFWNEIKKKLNRIWDANEYGYDYDAHVIYKSVIFPKFQKDTQLIDNFGDIASSGTNFYFRGILERREYGEMELLNSIIEILDINFKECIFLDYADFSRYSFNKELSFYNCEFYNSVCFDKMFFKEGFRFINCKVCNNASFNRVKFNKLAAFENTTFDKVTFSNAKFNDIVRFMNTKFLTKSNFAYVTFENLSIFRNSKFKGKLNLRDVILKHTPNFLYIEINEINRETARIIKDSFEQQNNIIEANRFYALEMQEREKELNQERKEGKNFLDWIIFKIHKHSSNHSQDWSLALFWIMIIGFISSYCDFNFAKVNETHIHFDILNIFKTLGLVSLMFILSYICEVKDKIVNGVYYLVCTYLIYIYSTEDYLLTLFAKVVNPTTVLKSNDPINGIQLLFKIIIAYLIYQLVVSIRQNTRRK